MNRIKAGNILKSKYSEYFNFCYDVLLSNFYICSLFVIESLRLNLYQLRNQWGKEVQDPTICYARSLTFWKLTTKNDAFSVSGSINPTTEDFATWFCTLENERRSLAVIWKKKKNKKKEERNRKKWEKERRERRFNYNKEVKLKWQYNKGNILMIKGLDNKTSLKVQNITYKTVKLIKTITLTEKKKTLTFLCLTTRTVAVEWELDGSPPL